MSETFKTIPGHNPIDALRYEAGEPVQGFLVMGRKAAA